MRRIVAPRRCVTSCAIVTSRHAPHRCVASTAPLVGVSGSFVLGRRCVIVRHVVASHRALSAVASCATSLRIITYATTLFGVLMAYHHRSSAAHRAPHRCITSCTTSCVVMRHIVASHRCITPLFAAATFKVISRHRSSLPSSLPRRASRHATSSRHIIAPRRCVIVATRTAVCGVSNPSHRRPLRQIVRHIVRHIVASRHCTCAV
jgi:hypothetical protein